jgi:hypothetical protein
MVIHMGLWIFNGIDSIGVYLDKVSMYTIHTEIKFANYDIPAKKTPTIDEDTFLTKPTKYTIEADISDTEKAILDTFKTNMDLVHYIRDPGYATIKTVRFESIEYRGNTTGNIDIIKWKVSLSFIDVNG